MALFILPFNGVSQNIYKDCYDGQIYLKIKETAAIQLPILANAGERPSYPYFAEILVKYGVYELDHPFKRIRSTVFQNTYQLKFDKIENVDELIKELSLRGDVEFAEKVPILRSTFTPNDTYANNINQWYLSKIKAYQAWDIHKEGSDVVLAIVDDAIRIDHQDLQSNVWINEAEYYGIPNYDDDGNGYVDDFYGWDAADDDNNPAPPNYASNFEFSHGTHCAGIAAGVTNNGKGVASISFNNAKIMACKGKKDGGTGQGIENAWGAFEYAAVNGADIISCSWSSGNYSSTYQNMVNWAANNGSIIVAAASNDNSSTPMYPAAYNNVISVANTTPTDTKNQSSNYGTWVDIAAPGTAILSSVATTSGTYEIYDGTSMACPLVAGLLAQMKSYKPTASNSELVNCLLSSADNINAQNPNYVGLLGAGRINAFAALQCLSGGGGGGNCDDNDLTLTITLDDWGSETTWGIYENFNLLVSGGPYQDDAAGMTFQEKLCLPNGCYDLVFFDSFGDGMCCSEGNGSYSLKDANGSTLAVGGQFQNQEVTEFCLNSGGGGNCGPPNSFHADQIGYAFAKLSWQEVNAAQKYQTRSRKVGTSSWTEGGWYANSAIIWGNMTPCTQYEFQVRSDCGGTTSNFSNSILVITGGCNDDYCYSYGLTWDDWIERVEFGDIDNVSGKNYGYANFTNLSADVEPGSSYPIKLTAATDDDSETSYWRIWIDFNQDEDFEDSGEMVFQKTGSNSQFVTGSINIPTTALTGTTRMRISMDINGYADPCETGSYRAVEDYSVNIGLSETLSISPSSKTVVAIVTSASFSVSSNVGWSIDFVSSSWVSAIKSGNTVNLNFGENTSTDSRTAEVVVKTNTGSISKTFTLTQAGGQNNDPYLSLSADLITIGPNPQTAIVGLNANTSWVVNIVTTSPWIGNINPLTGNSDATMSIPIGENTTPQQRVALLEFTAVGAPKKTVTIVQEGALVNAVGEEQSQGLSVTAYPNPVANILKLSIITANHAPARILLSDVRGRTVQSWEDVGIQSGQPIEVDVSQMPAGLYYARIEQGGRVAVEKVVVTK